MIPPDCAQQLGVLRGTPRAGGQLRLHSRQVRDTQLSLPRHLVTLCAVLTTAAERRSDGSVLDLAR